MKRLVFIIGGARSGKSAYAADLAKKINRKTVFIATASALDEEMKKRIRLHKRSRPKSWGLIEEPVNLRDVMLEVKPVYATAIVDCLGLWISNLLMENMKDSVIEKMARQLVAAIRKAKADVVIVVSNEVGCGIVPGNSLARRFRDLAGSLNQMMAVKADEVIVMQAGIPIRVK